MNDVCPACGVAVVPGYVRCPRCHAGLPGHSKRSGGEPGGTALAQRRFPLAPVVIALGVAMAIFLLFGIRGTTRRTSSAAPLPPAPIEAVPDPSRRAVTAPVTAPVPVATGGDTALQALGAAAADLENTLRRQRLWGRVVITGPRIDVRSGSCADPAMQPLIEGKKALLHGAGLTKLRCVEQSGAIVFERDL